MTKESEKLVFIPPKTKDEAESRREHFLDFHGGVLGDWSMKLLEEDVFGNEKDFNWEEAAKNLQKELDDLKKNE